MRARGRLADFRATGQTGTMIAGAGIAIDAVVADFISGAVEQLSPARDDGGWDVIEGQGSLFHPSFAGVSLGLLHGAQPDAIVMCHDPGVPTYAGCRDAPCRHRRLPRRQYHRRAADNPNVSAVRACLNTSALLEDEAEDPCGRTGAVIGLPCQDPIRHGVGSIVDRLDTCFAV